MTVDVWGVLVRTACSVFASKQRDLPKPKTPDLTCKCILPAFLTAVSCHPLCLHSSRASSALTHRHIYLSNYRCVQHTTVKRWTPGTLESLWSIMYEAELHALLVRGQRSICYLGWFILFLFSFFYSTCLGISTFPTMAAVSLFTVVKHYCDAIFLF